jgi:hypothetical protein
MKLTPAGTTAQKVSNSGMSGELPIGRCLARLWRRFEIVIVVVVGLVAINLIFISDAFWGDQVDPTKAGQLGDFVGGYIGTWLGVLSLVLLLATLRESRTASERLQFENKYFELIKMHRDNVAEMQVKGITGRRLFVILIRELRAILRIVRTLAATHAPTLSQEEVLHISYYCLYYGTGPNSSRMLKKSLEGYNAQFIELVESELNRVENKHGTRPPFEYVPFEGHQSRLGHYYRHLYQMIRFVHQQDDRLLRIDKYEYVKTMRAQLTTHEQALLLVNSLTPLGQGWWDSRFVESLMEKYKLVSNLPEDFFLSQTELDCAGHFDEGYFEWEQAATSTARKPKHAARQASTAG